MKLKELELAIVSHSGVFNCEQISDKSKKKAVPFQHQYDAPVYSETIPELGKLRVFYETFGRLRLYFVEVSQESAAYIASPCKWIALHGDFNDWIVSLNEDEKTDLLPDWIDDCLTIGEIPNSGNYLLMPVTGDKVGHVFEFSHDGFEFIELASDLEEYVYKMIKPDATTLLGMAAYMRFIEVDPQKQWWIRELLDNHGNRVAIED